MKARIEVNLSQDKIDCITSVYQTQVRYCKETTLRNVSENDANELKDSAPRNTLKKQRMRV